MPKTYKVMAYVLSSGLWDAFGDISLEQVLGFRDEDLEQDLARWQAAYNRQFKRHPHEFDWDRFNETGELLTARIREKLPPDTRVYYEPSDDREFFSPDNCIWDPARKDSFNEHALREKKRTLIHLGVSG